jgi:hypothetical protein
MLKVYHYKSLKVGIAVRDSDAMPQSLISANRKQ